MKIPPSPAQGPGQRFLPFDFLIFFFVAEPPGPQNGWNRTVYRYDPLVAQDLVVVETPNPEEGRNRILLRSGEGPVSVILIEWEVIR